MLFLYFLWLSLRLVYSVFFWCLKDCVADVSCPFPGGEIEQASEQAGKRRSAPVGSGEQKMGKKSGAASYFSHSLAVSLPLPAFMETPATQVSFLITNTAYQDCTKRFVFVHQDWRIRVHKCRHWVHEHRHLRQNTNQLSKSPRYKQVFC